MRGFVPPITFHWRRKEGTKGGVKYLTSESQLADDKYRRIAKVLQDSMSTSSGLHKKDVRSMARSWRGTIFYARSALSKSSGDEKSDSTREEEYDKLIKESKKELGTTLYVMRRIAKRQNLVFETAAGMTWSGHKGSGFGTSDLQKIVPYEGSEADGATINAGLAVHQLDQLATIMRNPAERSNAQGLPNDWFAGMDLPSIMSLANQPVEIERLHSELLEALKEKKINDQTQTTSNS